MVDFYTALKSNLKNSLCGFLNDAAAYKRTFDKIGPFDTPVSFLPNAPAIASGFLCNRPPTPPAIPPASFTGGQCVNTLYRVFCTIELLRDGDTCQSNFFPGTFSPLVTGPIYYVGFAGTSKTWPGGCTARQDLVVIHAQVNDQGQVIGQRTTNISASAVDAPQILSFSSVNIVPVNPPTDNCGNPTPFVPPFPVGGNTINSPTTFIDNSNNSITIPTTFDIGIGDINVNGEFNVPVTIKIGAINLEANVNINTGDISFGNSYDNSQDTFYSPTGDDCLPSGRPVSPLPDRPPDSPDPGGSPEVKAERAVLVGVICKLGSVGKRTTTIYSVDPTAPNVYAPYGALLWFSYRIGNSSVYGEDIKIKHSYQYVPCPYPGQAIGYKVVGRDPGTAITTVPVYGKPNAFKSSL